MTAEFRLLGDITALIDGVPVDLGHPRQRALLAVLLIEANRPVATEDLIERTWGDRGPRQARNTLYSYLSRLRRALAGADVELARTSAGYVLRLDESMVDLHRFRALRKEARTLADALDLWQATPLPNIDTPWFADVRQSLLAEHHAAQVEHADRALDAGQHTELLPGLERRAAAHPLDERVAGQLIRALYHSGRRADALAQYERVRARLADDLGVDPAPALRELHQGVLRDTVGQRRQSPLPRQLPGRPAAFVGRTAELEALTAALAGAPIAVVTGAGGIGKTWLALRWADEHRDRFPDGQVFVNLRGFTPAGEPLSTGAAVRGFLDALGVPPQAVPHDADAQVGLFRSLVADRRMLFVLDNARDSAQVEDLLPGSLPGAVIVTSRDRLAGLVSRHGAGAVPLALLDDADAHRLLADRLGDRAADADARAAVVVACAGLPLALAIAAARTATEPGSAIAVIAAELSQPTTRLGALDEGLGAVLDGSYRALTPDQARVFGLLGVAPGPDIGLAAAKALTGTGVSATLRGLERQSLLQQHLPGRWRTHDLVRLYAQEHAPDDRTDALRGLVRFWTHTAWTAAGLLAPQRPPIPLDEQTRAAAAEPLPHATAAAAWFDREYPSLLAGQRLALNQGWYPAVWQLAWSLHTHQHRRGYLADKVSTWRAAVAAATAAADPIARTQAHRQLGRALSDLGRHADAIEQLRLALRLADETGDPSSRAETRLTLGQAYNVIGDDRSALAHSIEALDIYATLDNPVRHAVALNAVGWHATQLGDYALARTHLDAALALQRQHHDRTYLADTLDSRGFLALRTGEPAKAVEHFAEGLALLRELGDRYGEADTLQHLGDAHAALGDSEAARQEWLAAADLYAAQQRHNEAAALRDRLS